MPETTTLHEAQNLPELLRRRAADLGDAPFVRLRDERLSYGEFDARTDALAAGLADLGVRQGDAVAVFLPNCIEFLEVWWAILKVGAIFNPVNTAFTGAEAAHVVSDARAVAAVCDRRTAEILEGRRDELPGLREMVTVDASAGVALDELRTRGDTPPDVSIGADDLAALVYTSGTTGRPKGAMLSHGNYVVDTAMVAELVPVRRGDAMGMILPLFHANAQVATTTTPIMVGASIAMWERFSASTFWETVTEYQPVTFSAVPTILAALLHAPGADEADTSSLEYVVCGAAPLARDLFTRFEEKFGLRILEGYGLTEGTCVSTLNPYWGPRKVGSIGLPLRGQEVVIRGEGGEPAGVGEPGEVCIRGANVMQGYYNLEEATAETIVDGWLHTGDVGYADEDGFIFLVDRVKDMIIRGGENIYPREIEEVLTAHEAVREVAVIGRPDEVRGEEVHAVVVLVDGAEAGEEELLAFCEERLARYKVPRSFGFMDELPKNATGKIDKKPLRAKVAEAAGA
jgi:acyl-CoA synthetase (AMP-forming)/AMP-acid ligase II